MRIISGKYKGRKLVGYDINGTRPTMDRIKESLFGMIQNEVKGSICLDLFAGSGSLGIEAISNGAISCYFVDTNKEVMQVLESNLKSMKIDEEYHLMKDDFINALNRYSKQALKFDLIFLDPPYPLNLINKCLELINRYDLLSEKGLIICEYEDEDIKNVNYEVMKEKKYGSKNIKIFKRVQ